MKVMGAEASTPSVDACGATPLGAKRGASPLPSELPRTVRFSSESTGDFQKIAAKYVVIRKLGSDSGKTQLVKEKMTGTVPNFRLSINLFL